MGSLAQEVSGEALPLPSSPLSRTFSFSSAPETTYTGWAVGTSCGRYGVSSDSGAKPGEKGGYRGKTGSCEKGEKADKQGLGASILDRRQSQPYTN